MKYLLFLLIPMFAMTCSKKSQDGFTGGKSGEGKYKVMGRVMETRSYCGGAAPTEEVLENMRTPIPVVGMEFLIRGGNQNDLSRPIVATITTDEEGYFKIDLPPGQYCLAHIEKSTSREAAFFEQQYVQVDAACDSEWLQKCEKTIIVEDKDVFDQDIQLHRRCHLSTWSPCASWNGPLPPSAPPRR